MDKIKKIIKVVNRNQRYIYVFLILFMIFLLNRSFSANVITAEDCLGGSCKIDLTMPALSDENPVYYVDEVFKSKGIQREYYRLGFDVAADQDSEIEIWAADFFENKSFLKKIKIEKSIEGNFKEFFFYVDSKYLNLNFEKVSVADGANIFINNVQVSKLNIENEAQFAKLIPTKRSAGNLFSSIQAQDNNANEFIQLCEDKIIFGQVFMASADYITAVALDMDIIKQGSGSDRKYDLILREVKYDGIDVKIRGNDLARMDFTLQSVEKYRREDGKFQFPIFSQLQKDKYYFIGLNNDRSPVDKLNCLKLRGSYQNDAYADGIAVVKTNGEEYMAPGDIYFTLYGPRIDEYKEKKFLFGSTIEGVGKDQGVFRYLTRNSVSSMVDLESHSDDIDLTNDGSTVFGDTTIDGSNFVYKFETIYPFKQFAIFGEHPNFDWNNISVQYSYDNQNWTEIPINVDVDTQKFNEVISTAYSRDLVFIKIARTNEIAENKKSKYGVKNFKFEAELFIK